MSDLQNQDSANDFQDLVQQALNAPNFAERRAKCLAFFQEDAAQFERKVPSDRIIQVKRIFKLIKELDQPAFKLLKSMRTAVGLLDEPLRDYILQGLKDVREGLKAGLFTASAAHALIFLEPFQSSYQKYMLELFKGKIEHDPSDLLQLLQNPQVLYWTNCFANAYLPLLAACDPAHWSLVAEGEHPKISLEISLDRNWFLAAAQLEAINVLSSLSKT